MSQDLLTTETHMSDRKGYLKFFHGIPVNGDEIQNYEAGQMYYDDVTNVFHIYNGTVWYGRATVAA